MAITSNPLFQQVSGSIGGMIDYKILRQNRDMQEARHEQAVLSEKQMEHDEHGGGEDQSKHSG